MSNRGSLEIVERADERVIRWMSRHGVRALRLSVGIVFFWFGVLKIVPGLSPAEPLAGKTMEVLTFGAIQARHAVPILAVWECLIGLGLIAGVATRAVLLLMFVQMAGTVTPLLLFPQDTFAVFPVVPTMTGQYIIKNLVLVSAGLVIGATVRSRVR